MYTSYSIPAVEIKMQIIALQGRLQQWMLVKELGDHWLPKQTISVSMQVWSSKLITKNNATIEFKFDGCRARDWGASHSRRRHFSLDRHRSLRHKEEWSGSGWDLLWMWLDGILRICGKTYHGMCKERGNMGLPQQTRSLNSGFLIHCTRDGNMGMAKRQASSPEAVEAPFLLPVGPASTINKRIGWKCIPQGCNNFPRATVYVYIYIYISDVCIIS